MAQFFIWLTTICVAVKLDVTHAQDIKPKILCEDTTVTVDRGNSGVIKHIEETTSRCSLIMTASSGTYVSISNIGGSTTCFSYSRITVKHLLTYLLLEMR